MSCHYYSESNAASPSLPSSYCGFSIREGGFQIYFHCGWPDSVIPPSFFFSLGCGKKKRGWVLSLCVVIALVILASVQSEMRAWVWVCIKPSVKAVSCQWESFYIWNVCCFEVVCMSVQFCVQAARIINQIAWATGPANFIFKPR